MMERDFLQMIRETRKYFTIDNYIFALLWGTFRLTLEFQKSGSIPYIYGIATFVWHFPQLPSFDLAF